MHLRFKVGDCLWITPICCPATAGAADPAAGEGCSLPRGPGEFYSSDCVLRPFCKTLGLIKMPLEQDVAFRDVKHDAELLLSRTEQRWRVWKWVVHRWHRHLNVHSDFCHFWKGHLTLSCASRVTSPQVICFKVCLWTYMHSLKYIIYLYICIVFV